MADQRSKVTLRPRSKLERVLDLLDPHLSHPPPPQTTLARELVVHYLVLGEAPAPRAASRVREVLGAEPTLDATILRKMDRTVVAELCPEARVDEVTGWIASAAKVAHETRLSHLFEHNVEAARRILGGLPGLTLAAADFLLLGCGMRRTVAPTQPAMRVAVRLGYPGTEYEAVARALDAEIPENDVSAVPWRAHHLLKQHGVMVCVRERPHCTGCRLEQACTYGGEGVDPAQRLS